MPSDTDPTLLLRASLAPGILRGYVGPVLVETQGLGLLHAVYCDDVGRLWFPDSGRIQEVSEGDAAHVFLPLDRGEGADRATRPRTLEQLAADFAAAPTTVLAVGETPATRALRDELTAAPGPEQPAPSGGEGDAWSEVLNHLDGWGLGHLRGRCEARRLEGIARYGVPLGRGDGRDGVRDLLEELADGAVYAARLGRWEMARELLRMFDDTIKLAATRDTCP